MIGGRNKQENGYMMIDTAGRQTPDMTGLTRTKGNGKPRIYKMADQMWVLERTYATGKGNMISVYDSWSRCIEELCGRPRLFEIPHMSRYL